MAFGERLQRWMEPYRAASESLPAVIAEPARVRDWLVHARRAQLVGALLVAFGVFGLAPVRDAVLESVFQPRVSSGFLGIGRRVRRHPMLGPAQVTVSTLYWLGALGTVGALLWLQLPLAAARAPGRGRPKGKGGTSPQAAGDGVGTAATVVGQSDVGAAAAAPSAQSAPGAAAATAVASAGRYQIEDELGRGGMGVVYRARDGMLGREVALKQLFPEMLQHAELAARFQREAQVLARLTHKHIVQVYDLVVDESGMWMAMELIPGGNLADRIEAEGALPHEEVVRLALQMAAALEHAHDQGVVHRDFKPGNVMLTSDGDVKVADFGLAGLADAEGETKLTRPGAMMGSPSYMSPEQITGGAVDARTDIYALGVTLYEMVSGRPPFEGATTAVLTQHLSVAPTLPPEGCGDLPPAFVELLEGMLAKSADERTPTMAEVIAVLST